MNRFTIILLLLLSINVAHAEEGIIKNLLEYDVEIIIFEDAHARYINSEDWAQETVIAEPETAIEEPPENLDDLSLNEINGTTFTDIEPGILTKEYKRINNSKEYNVLFYGSWRQSGLEEKKAFNIQIEELQNTHKTTSENTITGNFKLVLARYLHIYNELEYNRNTTALSAASEIPVTADDAAITNDISTLQNETFTIKSHRRMRSKVLHYIDHPLVGILIQINPVKVKKVEATEKSAAL